jgi:Glycosyl hydrolase family 30 beta sandwich domain
VDEKVRRARWLLMITFCSLMCACAHDAIPGQHGHIIDSISDPPGAAEFVIDGATLRQTMDGWGVGVRVFSDGHVHEGSSYVIPQTARDEMLDMLFLPGTGVANPGLGLIRVRFWMDNYSQTGWNSAYDFTNKRGEFQVDEVLIPGQKGGRQLKEWYLSFTKFEHWMGHTIPRPTYWAKYIKAHIDYLARRGVPPTHTDVLNEPPDEIPEGWLADANAELAKLLKGTGIQQTGPQGQSCDGATRRAKEIISNQAANAAVHILTYHTYDGPSPNWGNCAELRDLAVKNGKRTWMSEYYQDPTFGFRDPFDFAVYIHRIVNDVGSSGFDFQLGWLAEKNYPVSQSALLILPNSGATYTKFTTAGVYWVYGQFTRFVPKGSIRVEASSSKRSMPVSAFTVDGRPVIVVTNNGSDTTASFSISGFQMVSRLRPIRTTVVNSWAILPDAVVENGSFSYVLPGKSVTTFVATDGE